MAIPPRLIQLQCPECRTRFWVIGSLAGDVEFSYAERTCTACGRTGTGHEVVQKAPAEFLLQPSSTYPMTRQSFDHWVGILRSNFPDLPILKELGRTFYPCTPEEARPILEMKLDLGSGRVRRLSDRELRFAAEWLDRLSGGQTLSFKWPSRLRLAVSRTASGSFNATCTDHLEGVIVTAGSLARETILIAIEQFVRGDTDGCLWTIAPVDSTRKDR